jgi:PKD repeat protein
VYTYQSAGTYTVNLTVINAYGSDSEIKTKYITVFSPTSSETYGAESNPTGSPIGGGAGYSRIITETDARVKYVVSTKDQLFTALKGVKSGEVVFIKGTANIDLTGIYGTVIPRGVTLASDRGSNGSLGGRIFRTRLPTDPLSTTWINTSTLYAGGDNVRITGLRLEGPDMTTADVGGSEHQISGIVSGNQKGLEVDNCEIYGWSMAGITVDVWNTTLQAEGLTTAEIGSTIANIHHNYIHHCQTNSCGYAVGVDRGSALIKANIFDYTRHGIGAGGQPSEGYEASYNIHLGHSTEHIFDVHGYDMGGGKIIAGDLYKIHHNTIRAPVPEYVPWAVGIRGLPRQQVYITFNDFRYTTYMSVYQHAPPVYQLDDGGVGNISMTKNFIEGVYSASGPIRIRDTLYTDWW